MLTVAQAARRLNSSEVYIRRLVRLKKLSAMKHGRDWAIEESSVDEYSKVKRGSRR